MAQGQERVKVTWTQQAYFTDFLSDIGGLFTSVMAGAAIAMSSYQNFVSQKSLLKRLYGEVEEEPNHTIKVSADGSSTKQEILAATVRRRRDFSASYCQYVLVSCLKALCCCCKSQYLTAGCQRQLERHKKM